MAQREQTLIITKIENLFFFVSFSKLAPFFQLLKYKITSRNTCASVEVAETAKTVLLHPWNAATMFSAGITFEMHNRLLSRQKR